MAATMTFEHHQKKAPTSNKNSVQCKCLSKNNLLLVNLLSRRPFQVWPVFNHNNNRRCNNGQMQVVLRPLTWQIMTGPQIEAEDYFDDDDLYDELEDFLGFQTSNIQCNTFTNHN